MPISVLVRRNVAIVTLDYPEKLNALRSAAYHQLAQHMRDIAQNEAITVTVLIGKGRFFSAGIDVKTKEHEYDAEILYARQRQFKKLSHLVEVTEAFYTHPKVLVTILNGPVIGLSAALVAHSDFVYATPKVYLLAPFTSLGIVPEGASSITFQQRLGPSKAAEALLMSKRLSCDELVACGFINEVLDTGGDEENLLQQVLQRIDSHLGLNMDPRALLQTKALMCRPQLQVLSSQTLAETMALANAMSSFESAKSKDFKL